MGGCSMAWVGLVLAVFIIMVARKYLFEELMQQDMAFIPAVAATCIVYFIIEGIFGAYKWAALAGIIAGLVVGYFGSMFMAGGGGGDSSGSF